jgi:putative hydrolase of the HAD superfamily
VIEAVLFDVDGTLYLQSRLRALMAGELATAPWLQRAPWRVGQLWNALKSFRHVREELRALGRPQAPLERLQYSEAAARAGVSVPEMEEVVAEWIIQRPLKYLPSVVRPGTRETLEALVASGLKVGVFSDYPAEDKLKAMQLDHLVSLTIDATESDVNAFKPHPRGFLAAAERWGLAPDSILYVGDRPEVDAVGAAAAGMRCVVVGAPAAPPAHQPPYLAVSRMADLAELVEQERSRR